MSDERPILRPLLDLFPGAPDGEVCGPDGCAPAPHSKSGDAHERAEETLTASENPGR